MNVYDGERMAETLTADGLTLAAAGEAADLVVLNTCHIREKATEKLYSEIGRLKRPDGSRPLIAVAGCVAQAEGAEIARRAKVDVGRPQAYHNLPALSALRGAGRPRSTPACLRPNSAGCRRGGGGARRQPLHQEGGDDF